MKQLIVLIMFWSLALSSADATESTDTTKSTELDVLQHGKKNPNSAPDPFSDYPNYSELNFEDEVSTFKILYFDTTDTTSSNQEKALAAQGGFRSPPAPPATAKSTSQDTDETSIWTQLQQIKSAAQYYVNHGAALISTALSTSASENKEREIDR